MLERLRAWWRYARAEGKVLPGGAADVERGQEARTARPTKNTC
jgi:hypothetical protein